jgi:hypothetical protein
MRLWISTLILFLCACGSALAANKVTVNPTDAENVSVTIYSGPGLNFRPIRTISKKAEFISSSKLVQGRDGEYYKVLVKFKSGNRQVGYISTEAPAKFEVGESSEDVDAIATLFQSKANLQAAFHVLKNSRMYWTLGYMNYPLPNFYLRPFVGQLLTDIASSILVGTAVGTDHLFTDSFSFFSEIGAGFVAAPRPDAVFQGSESANTMLDAMAGIRFNAALAAVSIGLGETAIFNANNSYLGWSLSFTLEVGL